MPTPTTTHLLLTACTLLTILPLHAHAQTQPTQPSPASQPATNKVTKETIINTMENYFADVYSQPLRIEKDARLAHLIAAVSLAKIDGAPLTRHLFTLADRAKIDPLVAQIAWEALHARYKSLTPDQRTTWLKHGLAIAKANGFPGETAATLIAALASQPLDEKQLDDVTAFLTSVAEENDPATPPGKATLDTAATALAAWSEHKVNQRLVRQMRNAGMTKRIALMLAKLPNAPTQESAAAWEQWLAKNKLEAPKSLPAYTPKTPFFETPEKIEDPHDKKWKADTEIGDLRLSALDIVFCVDATGSMAASNEYVTTYLEATVKSLSVLTSNIRVGAVYYRHENVPEVMVDCCKKAEKEPDNFLVKTIPLTPDIPHLVAQMKAQKVEKDKGHDKGGGAYFSAITNAVQLLGPSRGKNHAQVAVVVGDTDVTTGSDKEILVLAERAKKAGYKLNFLVKDKGAAKSVNPASLAASDNEAIIYQPDILKMTKKSDDPLDGFEKTAFGKTAVRVIASTLPKNYANRADPLFQNVWRIILAQVHAIKAKQSL
jgi:hypothetical protein